MFQKTTCGEWSPINAEFTRCGIHSGDVINYFANELGWEYIHCSKSYLTSAREKLASKLSAK